mmetsp:Transcript_82574/g.178231  ORF Transcript_82574/g.178231 Transcript_82574/m.178231 type:complete len:267 (-) Transcript_82574:48-848(-)
MVHLLVLGDLRMVDDIVQSPLDRVLLVLSTHFLLHGCKHTLRIKEASEPVSVGSALGEPLSVLVVSQQKRRKPKTQSWKNPRKLVTSNSEEPRRRHFSIENSIQAGLELLCHHNFSVDGQSQLSQHETNLGEHILQTLDLLEQENVERNCKTAESLNLSLVVVLVVLSGHSAGDFLRLLEHNVFARHPFSPSASALGLRLSQCVQERIHFLDTEGQVGVGVKSKDLGRINLRERFDVRVVITDGFMVLHLVHKVVGHLENRDLGVE